MLSRDWKKAPSHFAQEYLCFRKPGPHRDTTQLETDSKPKEKSKPSSAFGRRVTSPSSNFLDATRQQHIRAEYSPIMFFLLSRHTPSPYKTQVQTQEIVQKAQINGRKMLGLILLLLLLLGGGGGEGNYSASTQPKNIFVWMDLGPAFQLTEASGQPCFASVGQAIKNTQTDTEQTYRETKACPKPELPTTPRAG